MTRRAPPPTVDRAELIRRGIEAERARRCVERGTLATAWWRDDRRYQRTAFARSIASVCDRIAADAVAGVGSWWALEAPPRHGKSEHVGRVLPARVMALRPGASVLYATSTDDRADDVSMAARAMVERLAPAYPHLEPGATWQRTGWLTAGGGRWAGVGAGVATGGIGAHLVVVDDVTGSAERQRSKAWKNSARRWLMEDVITRLEGGPLVVMETRRGLDDISGWLEAEHPGRLKRLTWRCRSEAGDNDPMGRAPGEYLWPERYGAEWHASMPHLVPGSPIWEALYQQRPTREGGAVILDEWCAHRYAADPVGQARACQQILISVDPAAKTTDRNDPTGIVVSGIDRGAVYVLHAEAERRAPPDTEQRLADLAAEYRATGRPVTILVEDTSVGQAWIPALKRRGLTVIAVPVSGRGDKVARMVPYLGRWAAGDVRLPASASWVAAFVGQIVSVPDCEHDDLWDAMSVLLWYLASMQARTRSTASGILGSLGVQ